MGTRCADHVTPLHPQKLALTSPTGGGRSVGIVRSRTKATEYGYDGRHLRISYKQAQLNVLMQLLTLEACIYTSQMYTSDMGTKNMHVLPVVSDTICSVILVIICCFCDVGRPLRVKRRANVRAFVL